MKILPTDARLAAQLDAKIARYANFPKEGIEFADIFTLLGDFEGITAISDDLLNRYEEREYDYVLGCESRGFIFAAMAAALLSLPFVPIRKAGKLPGEILRKEYELEYGTDCLEISAGAMRSGARVLLMDDLLATGGTARAAIELAREAGAASVDCYFLLDIALGGRSKIADIADEIYVVIDKNA